MKPNIDSTSPSTAPETTRDGLGAFTPTATVLTRAQTRAFELMVSLGKLFYGGRGSRVCAIKPRLFPLIVGPTGSGKSWLVSQAAERLEVKLLHFAFGTWVPLGARHDRPTQITIIDALLRHERVMLHVDEIDKVGTGATSDWGKGVFNDLFNVLDHRLEAHSFFTSEGSTRGGRDEESGRELIEKYRLFGLLQPNHVKSSTDFGRFVEERARTRLWIVGSGTWQRLFEPDRDSCSIGFGARAECSGHSATPEAEIIVRIRQQAQIPRELLARFSTELVLLTYPSRVEVERLLESLGINALARAVGVIVSADDLDFNVAGMRTLESLVTRLLLRLHDREENELEIAL